MRDALKTKAKGPWHHRVLIGFFTGLLGLLLYWLLGFVVHDIGSWPGPSFPDLERARIDPALVTEAETLRREVEDLTRVISVEEGRQRVLRDGTDNAARTMNQLLEIQRHQAQRGATPSETELTAVNEAQRLFLENQRRYQEIHERIAAQTEQLRAREATLVENQRKIEAQRQPAREEYERLYTRHQWKLAAFKLAFLVPLLAVAVLLFLRKRQSLYAPAIYALGGATLVKVILVMHDHFPRRYFKYFLIVAALVLVGRILAYLLRASAFPKRETLLRQYRESYEHFFCPVCDYPIRRGPLRYAFWTRRSLKRLPAPGDTGTDPEGPYVCPSCSTPLFEECASCHGIRHALLPACARCGAEKPVVEQGA